MIDISFSEAIQSAQDYILISYPGYNPQDSKELQPSMVIGELFAYLEKHYTMQGEKISKHCIYNHPFYSFDERYFQKERLISSYSCQDYQAACVYYKQPKLPSHSFVHDFDPVQIDQPIGNKVVDIKQLVAVARNPIRVPISTKLKDHYNMVKTVKSRVKRSWAFRPYKYLLKQIALKEPIERRS